MRPERSTQIVALILAAGYSSRMGSRKPLLKVGGSTAVEGAITRFREAGVGDVRVVVGHGAHELIPLIERLEARWIFNESYKEGMLSSILAGVGSFEPDVEAFFLLPVDTPLIKPQTLRECLQAYRESGPKVIYPTFRGLRGHPPLIATSCVAELSSDCEGGLRAHLEQFEAEAMNLDVVDQSVVMGCNTPEEYRVVLAYGAREDIPTVWECEELRKRFNVPERVTAHCLVVAALARALGVHLKASGPGLDLKLLVAAGCLHDLARGQADHAGKGAALLEALGYAKVARLVATHMELPLEGLAMNESALLYLADKCVDGTRMVSIEPRLAESMERFSGNSEALEAAARRLRTAQVIRERFERLSGVSLEVLLRVQARGIESVVREQRTIYLARHGAIVSVPERGRRYIGQLDPPLSDEGIRQAEGLREKLQGTPLAAIFCSDLDRSFHMAKIIAEPHGLTPEPRRDLREIALGSWEGLSFDEVRRKWPEAYRERGRDILHYRPPGGESFADCACRVIPALFDITASTLGDVLIVGHAGVNRILLSRAMGRPLDALLDIRQDYGCLNTLRNDGCSFGLGIPE